MVPPERLEIMGDLNVRGSEFKVIVVNKGGTVSVVESIYVDGKYEATVKMLMFTVRVLRSEYMT